MVAMVVHAVYDAGRHGFQATTTRPWRGSSPPPSATSWARTTHRCRPALERAAAKRRSCLCAGRCEAAKSSLVADLLKKGMVSSVYEQRIAKAAVGTLRRLDERTRQRIQAAIDNVAVDPRAPNSNVQPLRTGGFRLRVGDRRVLYDLNHSDGAMVVQAIRPRGGAYRP